MNIGLITGASSGMGREFVRQISEIYESLDELWVIGRDEKALKKLSGQVSTPLVILPMDLREPTCQSQLERRLMEVKPTIRILVNSAGVGQVGDFSRIPLEEHRSGVRLNCESLTVLISMCLPFMKKNSRIINLASAAAFLPQPGFALYAATKAYVLSLSRALRQELKGRQIHVTAVCPGPVKTSFFERSQKYGKTPDYKRKFMADPRDVVSVALIDSDKNREISVFGLGMRALRVGAKLIPHKLILNGMTVFPHK